MRADGAHARRVSTGGFDVEPAFAPDGRSVVFGRITGATSTGRQLEVLYVVDIDGGHQHQIVAPAIGLEHPDWSPDGRQITFDIAPEYTGAPHAGAIIAVQPGGRDLHVLAPPSAERRYYKPIWSPDGRQLLTGCHNHRPTSISSARSPPTADIRTLSWSATRTRSTSLRGARTRGRDRLPQNESGRRLATHPFRRTADAAVTTPLTGAESVPVMRNAVAGCGDTPGAGAAVRASRRTGTYASTWLNIAFTWTRADASD